ncbi:MAG TPA: hypothetical protein VMU84_09940 [Thermoanaerobaculia bacterium]|nr:hypothetical protein [Thermoanaerobaculia bacterium]
MSLVSLLVIASLSCIETTVATANAPITAITASPSERDVYIATEHTIARSGAIVYTTTGSIAQMRASKAAVYFLEVTDAETRVVGLDRNGGSPFVDLHYQSSFAPQSLELDSEFVYLVFPHPFLNASGTIMQPAMIARFRDIGGPLETLVVWSSTIHPSIAIANGALFYAIGGSSGTFATFKYETGTRDTIQLDSHLQFLQSIAADDEWLYEATGSRIRRIPKNGGAPETIVEISDAQFDQIAIAGDRVIARERRTVPRGCVNDTLVEFTSEGTRLLSTRGGPFAISGDSVLHAPRDCFLIAPQPPFVVERFCAVAARRRAVRF